ncbi:MAG: hypothetical protein ACLQEQ_04105 [Nitrososphaerales archaeon]
MTRIYIGCFGSGLGYATMMLDIVEELTARGASVELSSFPFDQVGPWGCVSAVLL